MNAMLKIPSRPQFAKQAIMLRVLYALIPVAVAGVYFFGWRVLALLAVSTAFGFVTEWYMTSRRNGKISYACFVTTALYALSLPPTTPLWIAAVGIVVAILFAKEAFGGFGKNVFNPAIVGRAFVYVCFPIEMTARFVPAFSGFPGGFSHWSFSTLAQLPPNLASGPLAVADAVTAATPMLVYRDMGLAAGLWQLFTGSIAGVIGHGAAPAILAAGSVGEVSALLLTLCGVYLLATKTAQWRLMASTLAGAIAMNLFLRNLLGIQEVPPLLFTLFSGALVYAAVFMVTDPVSAPKLPLSQWLYGAFIGIMVVLLRYKAVFSGAVAFAVLLGNMLAPSLDLWIKRIREALTKKAAAETGTGSKAGV